MIEQWKESILHRVRNYLQARVIVQSMGIIGPILHPRHRITIHPHQPHIPPSHSTVDRNICISHHQIQYN